MMTIITSYDVENESNYLKALNKNLENLSKKELIFKKQQFNH